MQIEDRRTDGDGTDTLIEIEELSFLQSGSSVPLDINALSGSVRLTATQMESLVELYIAYFNRAPDAIGLNFWGTAYANGTALPQIASLFSEQVETRALYPETMSTSDVVTAVYSNVLGRGPDAEGAAFWSGALETGGVTRDQFIMALLDGAKADPPAGSTSAFVAQQTADQQYLADKTDIGHYFGAHIGLSDVADAASVMALFDGSAGSFASSIAAIDQQHAAILGGGDDAFLMPLVGVLDAPDFL